MGQAGGSAPSSDDNGQSAEVRRTRTGGRTERVRRAVLAAAYRLLVDEGWDGLTIEAVAARAEVARTTVYRRWGTREALALDAVHERTLLAVPIPDTGSLPGDVVALGRLLAAELNTADGRALVRLAAGAPAASPLGPLRSTFFRERYGMVDQVVDRAVARGELPGTIDPRAVARHLSSPLLVRALMTDEPVDDRAVDQAAAVVLAAVTAGALRRADPPGEATAPAGAR